VQECRSIFYCTDEPLYTSYRLESQHAKQEIRRISLALLCQTGYTRTFFILFLVWKCLLSLGTVVSVKGPLFILRMTRKINMNLVCGEKSQRKHTVFGEEPVALPLSPKQV